MQDLKLTIVQTPLHWEEPIANRAMLEEKIWKINQPTDLIVLPEMFTTGFTMEVRHAEILLGPTFNWMKQVSKQTEAVLTGSFIVKEKNQYFNRLLWMRPDGSYEMYNKRHLFRMANEQDVYTGGKERIILELKGWKICPLICYDLRFPVFSRNIDNSYDLLLYVANWPAARANAWSTLLRARAIENISYVAGVNRIGTDGKNISYQGDSAVVDFKGDHLHSSFLQDEVVSIVLSHQQLQDFRKKFPAYLDADRFCITDG